MTQSWSERIAKIISRTCPTIVTIYKSQGYILVGTRVNPTAWIIDTDIELAAIGNGVYITIEDAVKYADKILRQDITDAITDAINIDVFDEVEDYPRLAGIITDDCVYIDRLSWPPSTVSGMYTTDVYGDAKKRNGLDTRGLSDSIGKLF